MATGPVAGEEGERRALIAGPDGVIRHWGHDWEDLLGYTSEEALGRKVDLIIPPVLHARHWRGFNRAIENGRLRRPDPNLRLPAVHKSGAIVPFRATLVLTLTDDRTVDGAVATLFGRGPAWAGPAWRAVLAPLKLGRRGR